MDKYRKMYDFEESVTRNWNLVGDFFGAFTMLGLFFVLFVPVPVWFFLAYICFVLSETLLLGSSGLIRLFWSAKEREEYRRYARDRKGV